MPESVSNETEKLAFFCADVGFDDLGDDVITACKYSLADTIGACYIGSTTAPGETIVEYVTSLSENGPSTIFGSERTSVPHFAALANGTMAHSLELDDGHRVGAVHPGSSVIPASLAAIEAYGGSGQDLLTAIAVGYEATITVAMAVQTSHRSRGFHATATCGCFGAAAAVANVLDLNVEETREALGLAGTQAGGLNEYTSERSDMKRFHPGRAAHAGVLAAGLIESGYDGPRRIIEGSSGFAEAFSDEYDFSPFDALGDPFSITERYVKPYPACRHNHGPIDLGKRLHDLVDPAEIEQIEVETYRSASQCDNIGVRNLLDAQMSLPYGFAVAFLTGEAGLGQFDPPRTDDDRLQELMQKTSVSETADMEARYPEARPARITITRTTGETHSDLVECPLGAAENPLSEATLREKFFSLSDGVLTTHRAEDVYEATLDVESFEEAVEYTALL